MDAAANASIEEILEYWFGTLEGPADLNAEKNSLWWAGGEHVDAEVRERFGALVEQACGGQLDHWQDTARGTLALVILLDQFTRNLRRGTAKAFESDGKAQGIVLAALDRGADTELKVIEQSFLCMPLMHAEDRDLARRCLEQFECIAERRAELGREDYPNFMPSAKTHADIVLRFGRYPHRNEIIGRDSTPEEIEFLADGGPSFGQKKKS
ncbi:MAG: DUF924 family protein [Myxococcota bacterium]